MCTLGTFAALCLPAFLLSFISLLLLVKFVNRLADCHLIYITAITRAVVCFLFVHPDATVCLALLNACVGGSVSHSQYLGDVRTCTTVGERCV